MSIKAAYITPHPPLIFPEIGGGQENEIQSTINSMERMAGEIAEIAPETIIIISPHSIMYSDYIHVSPGKYATGDMSQFKAPQIIIDVEYDMDFVQDLETISEQSGISAGTLGEKDSRLDHATMIPIRFINEKYSDYKAVRIAPAGISYDELYEFGKIIKHIADESDKDTVIIASGDLSHKLNDKGPYGYAKEGPEFDKLIAEAIRTANFNIFMDIDPSFEEKAADCGLRAFIIMAGALDKTDVNSELLSYEGPFGVGYAVGKFLPERPNKNRDFQEIYLENQKEKIKLQRAKEDDYVTLARQTVEELAMNYKEYKPDYELPKSMKIEKAGVFVSIKKDGELRGCIGTTGPVTENVGEEIIRNAISASSQDPRFPPVVKSELNRLSYSVDVLKPPEQISDKSMLDPQKYGVIVTLGNKKGLLLPNLDGVDSVDDQIQIAMQKAGIPMSDIDEISLQRFQVIRHY